MMDFSVIVLASFIFLLKNIHYFDVLKDVTWYLYVLDQIDLMPKLVL